MICVRPRRQSVRQAIFLPCRHFDTLRWQSVRHANLAKCRTAGTPTRRLNCRRMTQSTNGRTPFEVADVCPEISSPVSTKTPPPDFQLGEHVQEHRNTTQQTRIVSCLEVPQQIHHVGNKREGQELISREGQVWTIPLPPISNLVEHVSVRHRNNVM